MLLTHIPSHNQAYMSFAVHMHDRSLLSIPNDQRENVFGMRAEEYKTKVDMYARGRQVGREIHDESCETRLRA
jgi:hypothetical protein